MNFQDCYKVLIQTLIETPSFDTKKIFDVCTDSNDESVTLYTFNPITSQKDTRWLGAGANGGSLCNKLPFTHSKLGQLAMKVFEKFMDSMQAQGKITH